MAVCVRFLIKSIFLSSERYGFEIKSEKIDRFSCSLRSLERKFSRLLAPNDEKHILMVLIPVPKTAGSVDDKARKEILNRLVTS